MDQLLFFLFAAVFLGVIPFAIAQSRRTRQAWADAARRLRFTPGTLVRSGRIHGHLDGMTVAVYRFSRGSGKNRTTYTHVGVGFPRSLGLGLRLAPEGFFSGVTKFFGDQDVETGDAAFDDSVVVKGADARRIVEFLTPARRARVGRCLASHSGLKIDDDRIVWERRGVIRNADTVVRAVRQFITVARSLLEDTERDRAVVRAMAAQHDGCIEEALTILETPLVAAPSPSGVTPPSTGGEEEPEPVSVEEKVLEGELLYLADRREDARAALRSALEEAPEDPEVRGWVNHIEGPEEMPQEDVSGAVDRNKAALDASTVCADLFGSGVSSFDAARRFEERYRDRTIAWSGTLRGGRYLFLRSRLRQRSRRQGDDRPGGNVRECVQREPSARHRAVPRRCARKFEGACWRASRLRGDAPEGRRVHEESLHCARAAARRCMNVLRCPHVWNRLPLMPW